MDHISAAASRQISMDRPSGLKETQAGGWDSFSQIILPVELSHTRVPSPLAETTDRPSGLNAAIFPFSCEIIAPVVTFQTVVMSSLVVRMLSSLIDVKLTVKTGPECLRTVRVVPLSTS